MSSSGTPWKSLVLSAPLNPLSNATSTASTSVPVPSSSYQRILVLVSKIELCVVLCRVGHAIIVAVVDQASRCGLALGIERPATGTTGRCGRGRSIARTGRCPGRSRRRVPAHVRLSGRKCRGARPRRGHPRRILPVSASQNLGPGRVDDGILAVVPVRVAVLCRPQDVVETAAAHILDAAVIVSPAAPPRA